MYRLSEDATTAYEHAREIVRRFLNAASVEEIVWTRNATESVNLVAASWGMNNLKAGDEILISQAEHHANLIPWQIVCEKTGASLKIFKIGDDGSYLQDEFEKSLSDRVKLVAVTGMSNVLGTVFPIADMVRTAHDKGAKVLVDACQYAVHLPIDVQKIGCDFLAFSGHKTYGPTGIGVLYGKRELLRSMPPYQTGGDMVDRVTYEKTTFALPPARFEAGTPAIVEAVGLGYALEYMMSLGIDNIRRHEEELTEYILLRTSEIQGFKNVGTAPTKSSVFAFQLGNITVPSRL
jgi:cysteine desulfurase/selenocysteine lyase